MRSLWALLVFAHLGLAGCSSDVRAERGMSVLLVTIDTLRADRLGSYGDARARTPTLDRLARSGVRFDRAHAHNVVTLPSHANILAGVYPPIHGVRDNDGYRFPADRDTLATLLKAAGYRTAAFVSGFPLDARFGLGRGFDVYDDRLGGADEAAREFHLEDRRGRETVAAARRWLAAGDGASFCWVHLYDVHAPYRGEARVAEGLDPYRGAVASADAALSDLLAPLLDDAERARTLVVLTADHGESLGEHGERTHGLFAYEATLRVPLVVWAPRLFAPRVVTAPVRHVDVLPTVLDLIGQGVPAGLSGRSLRPLIAGGTLPDAPSYFEALSASASRGWAPLVGVVSGHRKFIDLPEREVYDLDSDPLESRNLAATSPRDVESGLALLAPLRSAPFQPRLAEDSETQDRLRSLGYLTATRPPKEKYTLADDPKRLTALEADLERVVELESTGDLGAALALCRDVVRKMPDAPAAHVRLALLQQASGDPAGALVSARQAFGLDPRAPRVLFRLAHVLLELDRPAEVVRVVAPFANDAGVDVDALMTFGVALALTGRRDEGLRILADVHARDPSSALCLLDIGTIHLMARDHVRARKAIEAALALEPRLARAHNALGVIAAQAGRNEEAIAEWTRAVEIDPGSYDTVFNLGMLLIQAGRPAEARGPLERFAREAPAARYAADIGRVRAWLARGSEVTRGATL